MTRLYFMEHPSEPYSVKSEASLVNGFWQKCKVLKREDAIGDLPGVQECVARCDWSVENSPQGCDGIRTLHSFDEMNEWHLSTSDLAHIDNMSESSSEENGEVVTDSNDQTLTNGYMYDSNGCHDNLYQGKRSRHVTEDKSLRETIEKTQDHCDKMADEFQRMRKYLQSMADHVYQAPLLTDPRLVCSRDLLDNDSESGASNRHSLSESPCASPRHPASESPCVSPRHPVSESPCASTRYSVSESPCASTRHSVAESPWTAGNYLKPNNDADFNVTRLKKGKSSVRLFAKQDNRDNQSDTHPDTRTDSVTLRQIVRDVCSEEAVSDLAVIRTQLQDKNEEIEQLHCENDDLASSISGLDTRIEDLSEQLSKLQSLNRSLQAQNFNLSTTLSHKDITFDKLKKYLNKGPPSRTQSSSPLDSIQEVSNNAAHKYGFLNRSTHTISRRKSIRPWKKRLAVLDDHNLSIFKVEAVESVLPVNSIIDIQIDSQKTFGKHVIIIRTDDNKEHFLQATTEDDMKEWIQKLHDLLPN